MSQLNEDFHVCFEHLRMYSYIYTKDCFLSLPVLPKYRLNKESFENDGQHHCYQYYEKTTFTQSFPCPLCRFQYLTRIINDFCVIDETYKTER